MISVVIIGVLLALGLWLWIFRRYWDKKVFVQLSFDNSEAYVGQQVGLTERVENRKKLPLHVLEVQFSLRAGLSAEGVENTNVSDGIYKRDVFSMLGMQRIIRKLHFTCQKRGYYPIKEAELVAHSLLFRELYLRKLPQDTSLYVYPKPVNVQDILKVSQRMLGEVQREKYMCEDPFAFRSIREYTPLDPQKAINWKASAKTGGLMVNTFDSSLRGKIMLYLDVSDEGILKYDYLVEESISVASSLAEQVIKSGMEVGICMNSGDKGVFLAPAAGRIQAVKILRRLARYEKKQGTCAFSSLLQEKPKDAVYVVISKNREAQRSICEFFNKQDSGIWVLPVPAGEEQELPDTGGVSLLVREVQAG